MKKKLLFCNLIILALFLIFSLLFFKNRVHIPKLYLMGNIDEMYDKYDIRRVAVQYKDGINSFDCYAELKVQGTSSLWYEKQNYTIKLFKDETYTDREKVNLGWGSESKYCLKANWVDKTHSRNLVTANLVSQINAKYGLHKNAPNNGAVDGFPIEVYNNGEFLGLFTFNIPKDEWLFGMDKNNPNHLIFFSEDWDACNMFLEKATYGPWTLEVGEETPENLAKLNRVFDFVLHSSDEVFKQDFEKYISLDAALNYYIVADFACMADNVGKNLMMVTYNGELWYPTLYDMDLSWGENWTIEELADYENSTIVLAGNRLLGRLEQNFDAELSARYKELRSHILSKEHIMEQFLTFNSSIPAETFEKEIDRWGEDIPGFDLTQIEHYLDHAIPLLDQKYENLGT